MNRLRVRHSDRQLPMVHVVHGTDQLPDVPACILFGKKSPASPCQFSPQCSSITIADKDADPPLVVDCVAETIVKLCNVLVTE